MSKDLNIDWFLEIAGDSSTREHVLATNKARNKSLMSNEFSGNHDVLELDLMGFKIYSEISSAPCTLELFQEIFWENNHLNFLSNEEIKDCVIDVGANCGLFVLKLKSIQPDLKILAIEANPYVFEILKLNCEKNNLTNVHLTNQAVSNKGGFINFNVFRQMHTLSGAGLSGESRSWINDDYIEKIECKCDALDNIVDTHIIDSVSLLKIDTEGMERNILEGSIRTLNMTKYCVIERHSLADREYIISFMNNNNFQLLGEEDPELQCYYADMSFEKT